MPRPLKLAITLPILHNILDSVLLPFSLFDKTLFRAIFSSFYYFYVRIIKLTLSLCNDPMSFNLAIFQSQERALWSSIYQSPFGPSSTTLVVCLILFTFSLPTLSIALFFFLNPTLKSVPPPTVLFLFIKLELLFLQFKQTRHILSVYPNLS